jgi:hypothetical protein
MWDDSAFRDRVRDRATKVGKKLPKRLADRLRYRHTEAPRVDLILNLAEELDWTVPEVLGISIRPPEIVNIDRLARALEAANRVADALPSGTLRISVVATEAASFYAALTRHERTGLPATEREVDLLISSAIARFDQSR